MLIQFPIRCFQAESFVRPYAQASEAMHALNADVVGFNPFDAWYSADLRRNDPFLEERPIIAALVRLEPAEVEALSNAGTPHFTISDEAGAIWIGDALLHKLWLRSVQAWARSVRRATYEPGSMQMISMSTVVFQPGRACWTSAATAATDG